MSILTKGGYMHSLSGLFQLFQPLTLQSIDLARHALEVYLSRSSVAHLRVTEHRWDLCRALQELIICCVFCAQDENSCQVMKY